MNTGLTNEQAGVFSTAFVEEALSFSCKRTDGGWDFLWTFEGAPTPQSITRAFDILADLLSLNKKDFSDFSVQSLGDHDWVAESYLALPAFSVGPFFIYGSHTADTPPLGQIPLLIEAATAFGSGEHGTTSCCLLAVDYLKQEGYEPNSILDMGCGSGILAAAAAKLWPDAKVYAGDNDPECIRVSDRHFALNNLPQIATFQSEGFEAASPVWHAAPYDFVLANILAGPLIDMADDLSRAVAGNGYLVLSGTLQTQAERVKAAYPAFELVKEFPGGEWMTLLMQKRAAT